MVIKFINSQIDGIKLLLKPNILSIGCVNDYWHFRDGNYTGTIKTYENDYKKLMKEQKELPNIKMAICQPLYLKYCHS